MAVVIGDKVFVNGDYVGSTEEFKDGTVIDIDYDRQSVYVID
jgi:hypothetical protein